MTKNKMLAGVLGAALTCVVASSAMAQMVGMWAGSSHTDDSSYQYIGASAAINGDNTTDGILVRSSFGYGKYEYSTEALDSNVVGHTKNFDLMGGYQYHIEGGRISAYLGGHRTNPSISPDDPNNNAKEAKYGVKAQLEAYYSIMEKVTLSSAVSFSTAYDSYWLRVAVPYDFGFMKLGPEITALGSKSFDQARYGLSVSKDIGAVTISAALGAMDARRRGDNSMYGRIGVSTDF